MSGKYLNLASSLLALSLLAGCQSSDSGGMLSFTKKKEEAPAAANPTTQPVVVQGQCPVVYLREGTAIYTQYANQRARKKAGDQAAPTPPADSLIMQATLDQTTRQCFQTAEGLRISVVVHGRVVLGPAGKKGSSFALPIRVAATDGDKTLYSELTKFNVTMEPGEGATQFVFTKDVLLTEIGPSGLTRVFAGIDEGPYNTR